MPQFTKVAFDYLMQSCRKMYFLCWLWHHRYVVESKPFFTYKGDVPPWEYSPYKVLMTKEEQSAMKTDSKYKTLYTRPAMRFHGDHDYMVPKFVNSHNYDEFIFCISFIWFTHMRNEFLEIYWVDEFYGWGLKVKSGKQVKASEVNNATWMAVEEFDAEDSVFMVHCEFPSLWQSQQDKKNHVVRALFGLSYYINSDWGLGFEGDNNIIPSRIFFCQRPVNQRNKKGNYTIINFIVFKPYVYINYR